METLLLNEKSTGNATRYSLRLFRQGIEYINSDRNLDALACFKKIYETEGYVPDLCYSSAVALIKSGRVDDAILACQSEIANDPDHRDAPALIDKILREWLFWPERKYLVNHDYRFVYCPVNRVMHSNMIKAILKLAGIHELHGHSDKDNTCKVHGTIYDCRTKECGFKGGGEEARRILKDDSYFKFTIVRNPWARLSSAYIAGIVVASESRKSKALKDISKQMKAANKLPPDGIRNLTFRQFIEYLSSAEDMEMDGHWRPQIKVLGDHKFDFIAKVENIDVDLNYINKKIGVNLDIGFKRNTVGYDESVSDHDGWFSDYGIDELMKIKNKCGGFPDYKKFYPPDLKEIVARRYACDIEAFGYDF